MSRTRRQTVNTPLRRSPLRRLLRAQILEDRSVPATFTVNALTDTGAGTGNTGDLRYCMTQAQEATSVGADEIVFDSTLFATPQVITLTGALPGVDNDLKITGTGSAKVTLDHNKAFGQSLGLITGAPIGLNWTIEGITLTNSSSTTGAGYLFAQDVNLVMNDVVMRDASVGNGFSAIRLTGNSASTLTMNNCQVTGNTASSAAGTLYSAPILVNNIVAVTLSGCTVSNNNFAPAIGAATAGGLSLFGTGGSLSVVNSTFANNLANLEAGAISVDGAPTSVSLVGSTFTGNKAVANSGGVSPNFQMGALYLGGSSSVTISNCVISSNSGTGNGGVFVRFATGITMDNTSVVNNSSGQFGGGLYWYGAPAATVFKIQNSTFSGNVAASTGGAIRTSPNATYMPYSCQMVISNTTIANNSGGLGAGAIRQFGGGISIESSVIDNNYGPSASINNIANSSTGTFNSIKTSLYRQNLASMANGGAGGTAYVDQGGNLFGITANLPATTADNGGGQLTLLPPAGSPVIDVGSNPDALAFDQRGTGFPRAFGGLTDMGAIEAFVSQPTVLAFSQDPTVTNNSTSAFAFQVTYTDPGFAFDLTSIKTGNITVSGPAFGSPVNAIFDSTVVTNGGKTVAATYHVNAPGPFFVPAENGVYTINLLSNQVKNTNPTAQFVSGGTLSNFSVAIGQVFTVNATNDEDTDTDTLTSLREAVLAANKSLGTDTIQFSPAVFSTAQTIFLNGTNIAINDGLVINNTQARVTIDALATSRVFDLSALLLTINNLTISNGFSTAQAGGLRSNAPSTITLNSVDFIGNSGSTQGGGAFFASNGVITINNSKFESNNSSTVGGAFWLGTGTVTFDNCSFNNNSAATDGGAIYLNNNINFPSTVTIRNTTVNNNSATGSGGGLSINGTKTVLIENTTISNNFAGATGGGFNVVPDSLVTGTLTVRNSTITQNTADGLNGGGISFQDISTNTINIQSTILAGNVHTNTFAADINYKYSPDYIGPIGSTNFSKSLLGVANSFTPSGPTLTTGGNLFGSDTAPLDPQLAPLASNGGTTLTHALNVGSPAINAGSNPGSLTFDQRGTGFLRTLGSATDIGAFESPGAVPTPSKVTSVVVNNGAGQRSRVTTLRVNFDNPVSFGDISKAFTLTQDGSNAPVTLSSVVDGSGLFVTITFTGGAVDAPPGNQVVRSLADGKYTLVAVASQFSGSGLDGGSGVGTNYTLNSTSYGGPSTPATGIYRVYGDQTGNGKVDADDFLQFRILFLSSADSLDFNGNGQVDSSVDLLQFRINFLKAV